MSNLKIDLDEFNRKAQHIIETVVKPQVERYEKAKIEKQNKMAKKNGIVVDASKLDSALEILDDLAKLLDDRIVELHKAQGGQQARHAYIFYREKVWNAMSELNQGMKMD